MKSDAGAAVATLDSHATTPKVVDEESCGRWRSDGQQRSASPARCLPVRTAGEASDDQLVAPSTAHFHGVCRARRRLCPSTHDQRLAPGRGAGRGGHKMGTNAGIRAVSGWYPAAPDGRPEQPREGRSPWSAGLFRLVTRGSASGTPNGIRTRAATLRGWCPRPLDDGGLAVSAGGRLAGRSAPVRTGFRGAARTRLGAPGVLCDGFLPPTGSGPRPGRGLGAPGGGNDGFLPRTCRPRPGNDETPGRKTWGFVRSGSGGRTRTPNNWTRTRRVTDYTTPERASRHLSWAP